MLARRDLLALAAALPLPAWGAKARWDAIVDTARPPGTVGTIAEALARAARSNGAPFRILLRPGRFVEKITVTVPNVTIAGSGPASEIVFGVYAGLKHPDGNNWGTGRSATLTIAAQGVTLQDLTVRNSYDYIGARRDGAGNGSQAVALSIGRDADRTRLLRCDLVGYQDTLYVQSRSLVEACRIAGGVDFIFGGAAAWFERCRIVTRFVPGAETQGYLAAPSTPAAQRFGFVFARCRIERERGVPDHATWLGRPWRAGGNMTLLGAAAFLHCWMDRHIRREGWTWMGYRNPEGVQSKLTPEEARLFEYGSMGPGAGPVSATRKLLEAKVAAEYTRDAVLGGWK